MVVLREPVHTSLNRGPRESLTSNTATSCPLRSSRKVRGCLESKPGITSQPRRGMETMWVFRSALSLWKMSLLSFTRHQRSRQRLLESTFRYPAERGWHSSVSRASQGTSEPYPCPLSVVFYRSGKCRETHAHAPGFKC